MNLRIFLLLIGAALAGLALAVVGTQHLITGNTWGGPRLMTKVSFSFSEFVVNSDALAVMPLVAVRMQYPLTLAALERDYYRQAHHHRYTRKDHESIRVGMTKAEVLDLLGDLGEYAVAGGKVYRDGLEVERNVYRNFLDDGFTVSFIAGRVAEKSAFMDVMGRDGAARRPIP